MSALYTRLIIAAVILAAFVGAGITIHHQGVNAGMLKMQPVVDKANAERDLAQTRLNAAAMALQQANAVAEEAKRQAAAQAQESKQARDAAALARLDAEKANDVFKHSLDNATNDKTCRVLQEELCDSVMGY